MPIPAAFRAWQKQIVNESLASLTFDTFPLKKKLTNIRQRQIYWLDDCEPLDGDADKDRPIIVLATPESLAKDDIILVVACSTHPRKKDKNRILVPSRHTEPETGLPSDCWAIPRWYFEINRFRLKVLKGNCPLKLFVEVLKAAAAQQEQDEADMKSS